MKHIPDENRILISLGEFISIARRKISPTLPTDENEPELSVASKVTLASLGISERSRLSLDCSHDGIEYRIFGYADKADATEVNNRMM